MNVAPDNPARSASCAGFFDRERRRDRQRAIHMHDRRAGQHSASDDRHQVGQPIPQQVAGDDHLPAAAPIDRSIRSASWLSR